MYNQKPLLGTLINWAHPLSKGLIGAWLFNEKSGNQIFDLSGYGNHGILTNMASPPTSTSGWNIGKNGFSIAFDGTNDYIDLGDTAAFDLPIVTIEAWFKTSSAAEMRMVVAGATYTNKWALVMNNPGIIMMTRSSAANEGRNTIKDTFNDGQWHHVVGITAASVADIKIYVDGVLESSVLSAESWSFDGNPKIGAKSATAYQFNGQFELVRIYNRGLNTNESKQLYYDPYCMFAQPMGAELMYAAPPVGAIINQFQRTNLGADLYDGVLIT